MAEFKKDTRRRQGGVFPLSDRCLQLLEKVNSHPDMTGSKFEEVTGLRPSSLIDWRNRKRAARGALVDLCKRLNCLPEELRLPAETCAAIKAWFSFERPPWRPHGTSLLLNFLTVNAYEPCLPVLAGHWTGRTGELDSLKEAFFKKRIRVTMIHGPSGLGKTTLARRFIEELASSEDLQPGQDVLWWTFTEAGSDALAGEVLRFFHLDHGAGTNPNGIFHLLANMFARRLVVVLDGLELAQGSDGRLKDDLLGVFLSEAARREHRSFVLVTCTQPVLELASASHVLPMVLEPLDDADAVKLLSKIGVTGTEQQLHDAACKLGGHPLLLQFAGNSLVQDHDGNVVDLPGIITSVDTSPGYLGNLMDRLKQMEPAERRFLQISALFRKPIHRLAFTSVFRKVPGPLADQSETMILHLLDRLQRLELVHLEAGGSRFRVHALIHQFIQTRMMQELNKDLIRQMHQLIMTHYLSDLATIPPPHPSLEDLMPYLEAAHHGCKAGLYDEVWQIGMSQLSQGSRLTLSAELQAFSTLLGALLDFFPENADGTPDEGARPLVSSPSAVAMIFRGLALACRNVGQASKSITYSHLAIEAFKQQKDWSHASLTCQNLAYTYIHQDALEEACLAADKGIAFARHAADEPVQWLAHALRGLVEQLRGHRADSNRFFTDVPGGLSKVHLFEDRPWLYSTLAMVYAHFLFTGDDREAAKLAAERTRAYASEHHLLDDLVSALVLLGRGDLRSRRWARAEDMLVQAWEIAKNTENQIVKIDALVHLCQAKLKRKKNAEARECIEIVRRFLRPGEFRYWERIIDALDADGIGCMQ